MINNINYLKMSKVIGLLLIMLLFSDYTFEQSCEEATGGDVELFPCSAFPTSDSNIYDCVWNLDSPKPPCREAKKNCNDITVLGEYSCSDFPTSGYMNACVRNEGPNPPTPCREAKMNCNDIIELGEYSCSDFPTSDSNIYDCVSNGDSPNQPCREAKKM